MASSAEAEAEAIRVIAKYKFDDYSREEADAQLGKLDLSRNTLRSYISFRKAILEASPGRDPIENHPPIKHSANKILIEGLKAGVCSTYEKWQEWCDAMEAERAIQRASGGEGSDGGTGSDNGDDDQAAAPKARQTLQLPSAARPRRKSRSPRRLADFELDKDRSSPTERRKRRKRQRNSVSPNADDKASSQLSSDADNSSEFSEDDRSDASSTSEQPSRKKGSGSAKQGSRESSKKAGPSKRKRTRKSGTADGSKPIRLTEEEEEEFAAASRTRASASKGGRSSGRAKGKNKGKGKARDISNSPERGRSSKRNTLHGPRSSSEDSDVVEVEDPGGKTASAKADKVSKAAEASKSSEVLASGYYGFVFSKSTSNAAGKPRELWRCVYCQKDKMIPPGKNTNLSTHREKCPNNGNPLTAGWPKYVPKAATTAATAASAAAVAAVAEAGDASVGMPAGNASLISEPTSTYRGPQVWGWLSGQQFVSPSFIRRMGLIEVIINGLPFTHISSPAHVALVSSIDLKAAATLVGRDTVRRDLIKFNALQKAEVTARLRMHDSLITLQHDAWTMKGYRFAFVATVATYVDKDWKFQELLLDFKVLDKRHSGATFAGHLIDTIKDFGIEDKWSGIVVSDSASPNRRMASILEERFAESTDERVTSIARCFHRQDQELELSQLHDEDKDEEKATPAVVPALPPPASVSAFPSSSQRASFTWKARDCAVLCFAHHLNIAIRDGFEAMGIKFAAQMKVITIPEIVEPELEDPADVVGLPELPSLAKAGNEEAVVEEEDEDVEDNEDEQEYLGLAAADGEEVDNAPPLDERDEDDDEDELVFRNQSAEIAAVEALGNGPPLPPSPADAATEAPAEQPCAPRLPRPGTGGAWSAVQRVEGFVVALHRSAERQQSFRATMKKEYYDQPKKAKAAFPTKPNDTRWNSQLHTLRTALNVKEAIDAAIAQEKNPKHPYKAFQLNDSDWEHIGQLVNFLVLAERISISIQASDSTLCDLTEYHVLMCRHLDKALRAVGDRAGALLDAQSAEDRMIKPEDAPNQMAAALRAMKLKLGKYRELAVSNRATVLATILHPCHRLKIFLQEYPEMADECRSMLKEALAELEQERKAASSKEKPSFPESQVELSPLKAARRERDEEMDVDEQQDVGAQGAEEEIARYFKDHAAWRSTDGRPAKWWKDNEIVFPQLAKLARSVVQFVREAEVGDLDGVLIEDEDVAGLEVQVQPFLGVYPADAVQNLLKVVLGMHLADTLLR
ncbi:hypothetical protein OC844_007195 [Tilletia horrida]|nr:hypothetical protein OC844_007195 [Tilletia horrida]